MSETGPTNQNSLQLSTSSMKTPISLLQEWCTQKKVTSKFEVIAVEGAVHAPTFLYRVTAKDMEATASGQSKKKAKHAAAKAILDKIMSASQQNGTAADDDDRQVADINMEQLTAAYDDGIAGNPVGQLQELCMERKWPPPIYDMHAEDGVPHQRRFSITCKIGKYSETGSGKSKKLAKRQAANKLLGELTNKIKDCANVAMNEDADTNVDVVDGMLTALQLKNVKIPTINESEIERITAFHAKLKASPGVTLKSIQSTDLQPDKNAMILLEKISTENGFNVTYVDIEHKSYHGKFQSVVQLATKPVAVCYGVGETMMDAHAAAAFDALNYLHIMTKS